MAAKVLAGCVSDAIGLMSMIAKRFIHLPLLKEKSTDHDQSTFGFFAGDNGLHKPSDACR